MGGAMISKTLIQFSFDGWGCLHLLLFTWGQTMVEVLKKMATSFKRSQASTTTFSAPNTAIGTTNPCLHWKLWETHRQAWVSLLWGIDHGWFSSVQFSSITQSCPTLWEPRTAACQDLVSITKSWSLPKLMSIESVTQSNHFILCRLLLLLPSLFPRIRYFQMSQLCT